MNLESFIMKDLERYSEQDVQMFEFYKKAINEEIGKDPVDKFNDLFEGLTKTGTIKLIDLVVTGYVYNLYKGNNAIKMSETEHLVIMQIMNLLDKITDKYEQLKLKAYVFALANSAEIIR